MRRLLVTQRVEEVSSYAERRDCLDQRWSPFLAACGFLPIPVPNTPAVALGLAEELDIGGIVLTGGSDIGVRPDRDRTETELVAWARGRAVPVLGVCRGMQVLLAGFGVELKPIPGHVATRHSVGSGSGTREVNSYHGIAATALAGDLDTVASAPDGVVEAFTHRHERIAGVMWHPEREAPFSPLDVALVRRFFDDGEFRIS